MEEVEHDEGRLAVRGRSLLDRPQRLGFLPTLWFWNDYERQRLLLPLVAVTAVPLAVVVVYLTHRFHLSSWWPIAWTIVSSILVQGLVERRIRKQLAAAPPEERLVRATAGAVRSARSLRRLCLVLAALSGLATLLAVYEVTGLAALGVMLVAAAVAVLLGAVAFASKRLTAHSSGAAALDASPEEGRR